jgi:hypothetical protein
MIKNGDYVKIRRKILNRVSVVHIVVLEASSKCTTDYFTRLEEAYAMNAAELMHSEDTKLKTAPTPLSN